LFHRLKTGEGQTIDISMQDCIWQLASIEYAPYYFLNGQNPPRLGNGHSAMVPCNLYPTKNDRVIIAAGVQAQLKRLYGVMGRQDLFDTPLCANQKERTKYRDQIDAAITQWTKTMTTEAILDLLQKADVPCAKLPSIAEVCNDPQLLSRNMIIEVDQTVSGKVKVPGSLFKLSRTPGNIQFPAPFLGENNAEVLAGLLGYTKDEIDHLSTESVI
jgi:CoA:oxalate CoA-transferase